MLTDDMIKKGNSAKELIHKITGSGGGREDRAQAGGKGIDTINDLIKKSKDILFDIL